MSWVDHAIWWHLYPLGFVGAPIRPDTRSQGQNEAGERTTWDGKRLSNLTPWLDYAVELGCNGLLLGPIFRSTSHGYDSTDQFQIDPRLGDEADFVDFVRQCKARGLRILLDGVFSHVGNVMTFWLERGIDGWRLDAAYSVPPGSGPGSWNQCATASRTHCSWARSSTTIMRSS